jgi:hypothetical protein
MSCAPIVLIITGYHKDEPLAEKVGAYLLRHNNFCPTIGIVHYEGRHERGPTKRLRRFLERWNPKFTIVLHSDENLKDSALLFYRKNRTETNSVRKLLLKFALQYEGKPLLFFDISNRRGLAKRTVIDLEIGSEMKPKDAAELTKRFAQYLAERARI